MKPSRTNLRAGGGMPPPAPAARFRAVAPGGPAPRLPFTPGTPRLPGPLSGPAGRRTAPDY